MAKKSKPKTMRVKAWGIFVAGNDCPDETFPRDWKKVNVAKWQYDRERDDFVIREISISYTLSPKKARTK